jgi:hypothetical protein
MDWRWSSLSPLEFDVGRFFSALLTHVVPGDLQLRKCGAREPSLGMKLKGLSLGLL